MSAGALLTTSAQVGQGYAQSKAARSSAAIMDRNAFQARAQAIAEERRLKRDRVRRQGQTRAAFGGAGVTLEGSPMEVLAEQAMEARENELLVLFAGEQRAIGSELEAQVLRDNATGFMMGGLMKGGSTLISEGDRLSKKGKGFRPTGRRAAGPVNNPGPSSFFPNTSLFGSGR